VKSLAEWLKDFSLGELWQKNVFAGIVHECGGCELINDNPVTAPSKRNQRLFLW
jgi:hypothetical protein